MAETITYTTPDLQPLEIPEAGDIFTTLGLISKVCISDSVVVISKAEDTYRDADRMREIVLACEETKTGEMQYTRIEEKVTFDGNNCVGSGTQIGARTRVGLGTTIMARNKIGRDNRFYEYAQFGDDNTIGESNEFYDGVALGNSNVIGQLNTFNRDLNIYDHNVVGDGNDFGHDLNIGDGNLIGDNNTFVQSLSGMRDRVVGDLMVVTDPADDVVSFAKLPLNLIEPGLTASGYVVPLETIS
jgi:UDP-3-O-[3-hydroxymyristoyl] glucosamine N-acyltransferase